MKAVHPETDLEAQLHRVRLESDTLRAIIAAAGSSVDLSRVLDGIVRLLTEATRCHACFVYIRDGDRWRMRAASEVYAHLVGRIELGLDEGLTGWVASHGRPAFIRDHALDDPRMKYVPELEEERFQSMVAVPVPARSGEVIGVVVLHTVAPREFDEDVLNFLTHTASLVAGAIENARLYEEAQRRVDALTGLAALSQRIVAAAGREQLYDVVTEGVRMLLVCDACQLHLGSSDDGGLALVASHPAEVPPEASFERRATLRDDGRDLGALVALSTSAGHAEDDELLQAVANQLVLALRKAELIERLTAENLVRDLFEALAADARDVAHARARAAGCDLDRPQVFLQACPVAGDDAQPWPAVAERVEARLRAIDPGALCDAGREALRALLPLPAGVDEDGVERLRRSLDELGAAERVFIGVSMLRQGARDARDGMREASEAMQIAAALLAGGGAMSYSELGAYRYLVHLPLDAAPRDRLFLGIERLLEYDERRRTHLLPTLEQYLGDRRSGATTARKLFIHPNTLRQRLDRIKKVSGLDLLEEDLLSLELAVKLARLRRATDRDRDG
ncbi:MAG TPA: GAF domain-containing protein [Solirubrobacteraceae bacterium]